ncbi:MAG: sugar transferase [Candidatus Krumholzibacteria bacterium]|nr:sugar transferase [Candidatus Krumholzibacteria bacterium]
MSEYSAALDNMKDAEQSRTANPALKVQYALRRRTVFERSIKRSIDVIAASMVLIVGFPFFLAIALLIRITSRGPVFFVQKRIGENGGEFALFKFRTMRPDTDDTLHREFTRNFIEGRLPETPLDGGNGTAYKMVDDPRVTAVGRFLRKTSLDELPQFINILKGEMTIVGPRPPLPYEYECYDEWHKLRLKVRPGLTGLWQVSGRSRVPFHEMVAMDIYYIERWSLLLDLKIMLRTVPVMLGGTGGC